MPYSKELHHLKNIKSTGCFHLVGALNTGEQLGGTDRAIQQTFGKQHGQYAQVNLNPAIEKQRNKHNQKECPKIRTAKVTCASQPAERHDNNNGNYHRAHLLRKGFVSLYVRDNPRVKASK